MAEKRLRDDAHEAASAGSGSEDEDVRRQAGGFGRCSASEKLRRQEELKRQRELLDRIRNNQQDSSTAKPLLKPNTEEERSK